MNTETVTIRQAIMRGKDIVDWPSKVIMVGGTVLSVLLLLVHPSGWDLIFIPAGIFFFFVYSSRVTASWRIWAYENVGDINQFQRSAETAELLLKHSYDSVGPLVSAGQRAKLKALIEKFETDEVFVDDLSIPAETTIYSFGFASKPAIILNDSGINVVTDGFCEWSNIENERVAIWSESRTGGRHYKKSLRFDCPTQNFDIPLSSLAVTDWELDLYLYIYRGRFSARHPAQ